MSQKSTAVELQDNSGNQVRAVSHESDYPLPPVAELEKLHQFRLKKRPNTGVKECSKSTDIFFVRT